MEVHSIASATLAGTLCVAGDLLGTLPAVIRRVWLRAAVDNLTHGLVGACSWEAVIVGRLSLRAQFYQSLLAGALAMALDVDHFLMAGSFHLKHAVSLPRRPPFHATSIIPVVALVLWLVPTKRQWMSYLQPELPWLFCVSWLSHHIRDGTRRGLWFWPFGSTSPLPTWLYLGTVVVLPLLSRLILVNTVIWQTVSKTPNGTLIHL